MCQGRLSALWWAELSTRLEDLSSRLPWWGPYSSSPPSSSTWCCPTLRSLLLRLSKSCAAVSLLSPSLPPYCRSTVKPSMKNALSKPAILIALFKVGSAAASLGFLQTTLEPHLHDLRPPLSSFQVGALFMVVGGTYGLSLPLWGYLCDSQITRNSPKFVEVIGAILIAAGFLVLGKSLVSDLAICPCHCRAFQVFAV